MKTKTLTSGIVTHIDSNGRVTITNERTLTACKKPINE